MYVRDGSGTVVSIYETQANVTSQYEIHIYGKGRIGRVLLANGTTQFEYELTDHLGNVRAVVGNGTNGAIQLFSWSDYNPLGSVMSGRNSIGTTIYRYGYQGQFSEMDNETGYNSFDLRMYDPIKGRWDIPDPYHQYHSPYKAMGNNFVALVDPTGGETPYIEGMEPPEVNQYLPNVIPSTVVKIDEYTTYKYEGTEAFNKDFNAQDFNYLKISYSDAVAKIKLDYINEGNNVSESYSFYANEKGQFFDMKGNELENGVVMNGDKGIEVPMKVREKIGASVKEHIPRSVGKKFVDFVGGEMTDTDDKPFYLNSSKPYNRSINSINLSPER